MGNKIAQLVTQQCCIVMLQKAEVTSSFCSIKCVVHDGGNTCNIRAATCNATLLHDKFSNLLVLLHVKPKSHKFSVFFFFFS